MKATKNPKFINANASLYFEHLKNDSDIYECGQDNNGEIYFAWLNGNIDRYTRREFIKAADEYFTELFMKTISKISTGVLSEFSNFFGNVEFNSDASQEAYVLLKDELDDDMKNSLELWTAEFKYNDKMYAIAGDGDMTSDGNYVVAEIAE